MIVPSTCSARAPLTLIFTLIVSIAMLAGRPKPASAALLVYEPFDYAAGTLLDQTAATGENLTGEYVSINPALPQQFQLVAQIPGLDYGSLSGVPSAAGNRLGQTQGTTSGGVTVSVDQDVVVNPNEAIFFSALFVFDDSLNGNHLANITFTDDETGDQLAFGESIVGSGAIRISADTAATGALIAAGADDSFVDGQTLLLVGRYFNSAAANGDILELVGYDTADADELPASFDPADPNAEFSYALTDLDIDFAKITSITFRIRGTSNNFIDELRIGPTYASVAIPEPETSVLLLLTGLTLLAGRVRSGLMHTHLD